MFQTPAELDLLGIYFPPFFLICLFGLLLAAMVANILNRAGLSRYFWHPPLAFLAIWILLTSLIGHVWITP